MRALVRIVALVITGVMGLAVAGAIAARKAKERIVRRDDPDAGEVAVAAIFEPLAFRSQARLFRGGTLDCWYGGGVFDLRDATLAPEGATLRVKAVFGGGQILVPESWRVETRVVGIGGIGDSRRPLERGPDAPRLAIEGVVIFGGFGIASQMPEDGERWMRRTRGEETSSTPSAWGGPVREKSTAGETPTVTTADAPAAVL